jgi:hypothetical protein
MLSSGMLHRVALVRTDVSEELRAPFIRVTRIGEPGTLAVTSSRRTPCCEETLPYCFFAVCRLLVTANFPTRATRHNIPEDGILYPDKRSIVLSTAYANYQGHLFETYPIEISMYSPFINIFPFISTVCVTLIWYKVPEDIFNRDSVQIIPCAKFQVLIVYEVDIKLYGAICCI